MSFMSVLWALEGYFRGYTHNAPTEVMLVTAKNEFCFAFYCI